MSRKRTTYKPKFCYGGYENSKAEKPLVCVSATTIVLARQAIAAWCDLQSRSGTLYVRKHVCTLPCEHTHWVVEGLVPSVPVQPHLSAESPHERAMRRQAKILKDYRVE